MSSVTVVSPLSNLHCVLQVFASATLLSGRPLLLLSFFGELLCIHQDLIQVSPLL